MAACDANDGCRAYEWGQENSFWEVVVEESAGGGGSDELRTLAFTDVPAHNRARIEWGADFGSFAEF
eukprot:SAG11_NODE_32738_length_281_cov_0.840659_1_plen_66_part_01